MSTGDATSPVKFINFDINPKELKFGSHTRISVRVRTKKPICRDMVSRLTVHKLVFGIPVKVPYNSKLSTKQMNLIFKELFENDMSKMGLPLELQLDTVGPGIYEANDQMFDVPDLNLKKLISVIK